MSEKSKNKIKRRQDSSSSDDDAGLYKIRDKKKDLAWSLPKNLASYANKHTSIFMEDDKIEKDKDIVPPPKNINEVQDLDYFLSKAAKKEKWIKQSDSKVKRLSKKARDMMGPLCAA